MTPRERVLTALEHREPDRVPVDFWASSETTTSLVRHLGLASKQELLREFAVDLRVVEGRRSLVKRWRARTARCLTCGACRAGR